MVYQPYLGEIHMFGGNYAPTGYALCNGQVLSIAQNSALFSILGTTYGGDGQTTFGLPNLQGRIPVHMSGAFPLGQSGGEVAHTLTTNEMPVHTHTLQGASATGTQRSPLNNVWAVGAASAFSNSASNTQMSPQALESVGGSQSHDNLPPYQVVTFIIALTGLFPPPP